MVLCKFFQQGSCRFGSKCVNEHLDIKQVIKTDVEAAINGKQWPLSTYGPFKDKPSIPNFIEDQSFEEIRMLCYEAKQKNFFEQFHQQFTKEATDANNKMKALLQMTPEVIDVLMKVYDMPSDLSCSGATAGMTGSTNNSNPFGTSNAGSIFAKSNTATSNNIFGNTVSGGGGFGSANTTGNKIFGSTAHTTQSSTSIFGNATTFGLQQQQQGPIFGQTTVQSNSIFGGSTTNSQQKSSIFGQQQSSQTNAPTIGGNIFASAAQQQPHQFGLFSQQNQQPQPQQSSLFGQQQNSNIYGQAPQASQAQPSLFSQPAQTMQQQQHSQGLFSQVSQQQPVSGQGLFSHAAQQTQSVFGQSMQQQPGTNIFQQQQSNTGQQQQLQSAQPAVALFQQSAQQNQNSMNAPVQVSPTLYSRIEDLTAEEIAAFKADCFQPGKIPFNPPPRELIN